MSSEVFRTRRIRRTLDLGTVDFTAVASSARGIGFCLLPMRGLAVVSSIKCIAPADGSPAAGGGEPATPRGSLGRRSVIIFLSRLLAIMPELTD